MSKANNNRTSNDVAQGMPQSEVHKSGHRTTPSVEMCQIGIGISSTGRLTELPGRRHRRLEGGVGGTRVVAHDAGRDLSDVIPDAEWSHAGVLPSSPSSFCWGVPFCSYY